MKCLEITAVASACIAVVRAIQPGAAPARPAPLRDLEFGDINFLQTTDVHGWHAGHLLEPSFSADWGDYISFAEHLRTTLEAEGKDLLVIESGDRIEGNGLYDSSTPRGRYTFDIISQQHVDLICIGNHELYKNTSAEDEYTKLVPAYKENYLASNLEIIDPDTGELTQLAPRHRTFTTKNGIRILAFGFIFDFTRNDKNTRVVPVEQVVKHPWFQTAVTAAKVDLIVVNGHVALRSQEFEVIHHAIRAIKPDTPIQFFGGHYHIRDYRIFDEKSYAFAGGRFMETIGFQSISNLNASKPTFSRRYIDNNLYSMYHHSNTTPSTFDTPQGLETTKMITDARSALNLDETFGCTQRPYWMSRTPYPSNDSIFSLLTDQFLPSIKSPDRFRHNKTRMLITNTGAIRFDIFAGPFTRDSTFIVSPFTSNLSFIPNIPYKLAKQILPILNGGEPQLLEILTTTSSNAAFTFDLSALLAPEQLARRALAKTTHTQPPIQHPLNPSTHAHNLIPGYTTHDDLGSTGDDTIHTPTAFYDIPNCVQTIIPGPNLHIGPATPESSDEEPIDLIFNHFLAPYILQILNFLPHLSSQDQAQAFPSQVQERIHMEPGIGEVRKTYTADDISNYVPGETFTTLLAKWVSENWKGNCNGEMRGEL